MRLEIVEVPALISGLPGIRIKATIELCKQLRRAKSYSVIGADIMDGVYSPDQSISRMSSVNCAILMDVPARILGFSWSPNSKHTAKIAMRRIGGHARILARDPQSLERLDSDGVSGLEATSDTVFSLRGEMDVPETDDWIRTELAGGRNIALLNISGLIAARIDLSTDYSRILEFLLSANYSVVLLPHVIRDGDDDLLATEKFTESLSAPLGHVYVVKSTLRPQQIRRLATQSSLVVTGRMHLAVIALSSEVPTITLGTQGKVEGLYDLLGIKHLCLEPRPGFSSECVEAIKGLIANPESAKGPIRSRLPEVVGSSSVNFSGLRE
ncbi:MULTISPECIES: polysaccharide pyruvyl transferase family protein [unclassified Pseudarthrobacter]|uniref:polysaccharide pyruvyl transferase family protein n=1 Tax=unclassified Pseudarthrobacter TaxID=2647000 RepID=UPI00362A75BF